MSDGSGLGRMFALVVVLFVLLIIVGCSCEQATMVATKSCKLMTLQKNEGRANKLK